MSCSHQVNKNHQQRCNALTTWPVVGAALTTPVSHAPQATWCVTCEMAWHILYAASADNPGCITPSLNIVHTLATLAFWTSFRRNLLHPDILPWQCQTHILRLRACHRKQTSLRRSRASQLQDYLVLASSANNTCQTAPRLSSMTMSGTSWPSSGCISTVETCCCSATYRWYNGSNPCTHEN